MSFDIRNVGANQGSGYGYASGGRKEAEESSGAAQAGGGAGLPTLSQMGIDALDKAGEAGAGAMAGGVSEIGQTDTFCQCPGSTREAKEANVGNSVDRVAQFQQKNAFQ